MISTRIPANLIANQVAMSTKMVDVKTPLENENKIENKNKEEEEGTIEKTNKYYLRRNT